MAGSAKGGHGALRSLLHVTPLACGLLLGAGLLGGALPGCGARSSLYVGELCRAEATATAEVVPLDAFIMLDTSGSMDFSVAGQGTRWSAVRSALASFLNAPGSVGMGVSLSFFPIIDTAVPEECTNDDTCGMADACQPRPLCLPSGGGLCGSDADCAAAGFVGDSCQQTGSVCQNRFTCEADSYAVPVVPLAQLPGAQGAMLAALDAQLRTGGTPTLPALTGVVQQAQAHAAANPDHETIVILAGDGLPTACDPALHTIDIAQAIDNLAMVAADAAASSVRVFIIGVAVPEGGTLKTDLDTIASAGGTGSAYIITSGPALSEQLLEALNDIRIQVEAACSFTVARDALDIEHATVTLAAGGGSQEVALRSSVAACNEAGGYYLEDSEDETEPVTLTLCPASCAALGQVIERKIELRGPCAS